LPFCQGQDDNAIQKNIQSYFPADVFKDSTYYSNKEMRYAIILNAMNEPVIYSNDSLIEMYRFIWLRSLKNPIIIRIEKQENDYILSWKILNCTPETKYYYECILIVDKQKIVDEKTWIEFKNLLSQTDFWNMATNKIVMGFDGAQWILEGKNNFQYHVVDRWSPSKKNPYYQCCDFLIRLTDLRIPNRNKY
jgi:hypothetical protein